MDFGGTLSKIVYFETQTGKNQNLKKEHDDTIEIPGRQSLKRSISLSQLDTPDHQIALDQLYTYMDSSKDMGGVSTRDNALSFYSNILGGRLHFLHFETRNMVLLFLGLLMNSIILGDYYPNSNHNSNSNPSLSSNHNPNPNPNPTSVVRSLGLKC
jgi:hypothetical protein